MLDLRPFEDTSMLSLYRKCLKAIAPLEKKGCPARNALFEDKGLKNEVHMEDRILNGPFNDSSCTP